MKKFHAIISAALLIVAAVSCAKENIYDDDTPTGGTTFTVSLGQDTKLAIDGSGKTTWTLNDKIVIYNGNYDGDDDDVLSRDASGDWTDGDYVQDRTITSEMISPDGKYVTFTVDLPEPQAGKWYLAAVGDRNMVSAFRKDGSVCANFPQNINFKEDTRNYYIPFLAATTTTTTAAVFHNVSTLVSMKCSDADVKYVTFESNEGNFIDEGIIHFNNDGTINSVTDTKTGTSVFSVEKLEELGADKYYYVGMFEQTLSNGFTIKTYEGAPESTQPKKTIKQNVNLPLYAGHVLDLGDIVAATK